MSVRILVIEDDPASQELMSYLLGAHGYVALTASRGDEGVEVARRERPDLVICDIQLPGLDGYAVARMLKAEEALRAIPLVAFTALAMVGDRERVLAAGFDTYLSKPIDPMNFVPEVERLLQTDRPAQRPRRALVHHDAGAVPRDRGVILVVDDRSVNLELKRSIFEPLGFQILTAQTVAEGLEMARSHRPALILSDIGLPDASGLDLLRRLQADPELQRIPLVIITSTHPDDGTKEMALSLGACRFLVRPMDAQQLVQEIEPCLARTRENPHGHDSGRR